MLTLVNADGQLPTLQLDSLGWPCRTSGCGGTLQFHRWLGEGSRWICNQCRQSILISYTGEVALDLAHSAPPLIPDTPRPISSKTRAVVASAMIGGAFAMVSMAATTINHTHAFDPDDALALVLAGTSAIMGVRTWLSPP